MPKLYVQCGPIQLVTTANDSRAAALWSLHHYMGRRVDVDAVDWFDPTNIERADLIDALIALDDTVEVSEIGFGRQDAGQFDIGELWSEWNQWMIASARLESAFDLP